MEAVETAQANDLLTVKEVVDMFRTTPTTVYRMIDNGDLVGFRFGKQWRITRDSLDEYLASQEHGA